MFVFMVIKGYPQNPLQSVAKTYFRSHPFDSKFSTFILNLQKDPWFTIEEFKKRTDTTFFFLSGIYKNFNPFRYIPAGLKLTVAEEEIIFADSLRTHDTIMNLQLLGMVGIGGNGKVVEKEFSRFHNSQSHRFTENSHIILGGKENITGEIYNYFISPFSIAPVTIAWGLLPGIHQYAFTITIRFKVSQNVAIYIIQPGDLNGL